MRRYTTVIAAGLQYGTSKVHVYIRDIVKNNLVTYRTEVIKGHERLDTLAGKYYDDGSLWWVIAAASNIGWGLQVPPNTIINIPDLAELSQLLE